MKRTICYLATTLVLVSGQACKKTTAPTTETNTAETVEVSINANESYRYSLPSSKNESYSIETAEAKASVSTVISDSTGTVFVYTPAQDFVGSDTVVVTSEHPHHGSGGCGGHHHHHHKHKEGEKSKHSTTFCIKVNAVATNS